ncbi:YcaO-like family protein [Spongiactinospora sp. TRM90649]|uniref:YcaO-like family protein n=1 Tax=Spongiactinospora sp. TRM90649 TaxID=3031114 RepID=UPI0023F83EE3|nr:YcaO-like family protein [Spongiactinospora sp. TRM90649]MDF5757593.1 YcaO-like family protein [Spongiactinospora sp. TRM90649]
MADTPLSDLVGALGVVSAVRPASPGRGFDRVKMFTAVAGGQHGHAGESVTGTGRVLDDERLAELIAVAEAAERYAGSFPAADTITAPLAGLPGRALDVTHIPRCSAAEYAHPDCRHVPFDEGAPIRWIRGVDMSDGEPAWVPAVMACYGLRPEPAERFVFQISTGHAIHFDPVRALAGGLLEVIERDAVALVWTQRLPLPPLAPEAHTERVRYLLASAERRFLTTHLFDATTDLGVPTVYLLQRAPYDARTANLVAACAAATLGEAAEKALIEAVTVRSGFHDGHDGHDGGAGDADAIPRDITSVLDATRYMARPERAAAFAFLTDGLGDRAPADRARPLPTDPADPAATLAVLLDRLAEAGMRAYAVDRTPAELRAAGLTKVSVIVPDLQPLSLHPRAQFRAHPRLRDAPPRMGFPAYPEEEQNPWPQPFA